MPVTIENPSNVVRNTTFTSTITPTVDAGEVITSITCVDAGTQDSGITISTSSSAITLSGSYEDAFDQDEIKSVPVGESDLTTTPTISTTFSAVPSGHRVFSAVQDDRATITKTYTATIEYEDDSGVAQTPVTINFNHEIDTDTVTFAAKLKELYPPDGTFTVQIKLFHAEMSPGRTATFTINDGTQSVSQVIGPTVTVGSEQVTSPVYITHDIGAMDTTNEISVSFGGLGQAGGDDVISDTISLEPGSAGSFGTINGASQQEETSGTFNLLWNGTSDGIIKVNFKVRKD
jgi:hypothetical protein